MLVYAQIEDAVIERIRNASESGALGYRLAEVASYGGQFDDETFFTQVRRFPAAWVTVGGSKPRRLGARSYEFHPVIAVMVGSRNVRGERQTRHGSVNEPGSYQMLDDVRALLAGQTLGLAIDPLSLGPDRTLYNTRLGNEARSVLAAEFGTRFTYKVADPTEADALDLRGVNLNYLLKPGDEIVDARDEVTLQAAS